MNVDSLDALLEKLNSGDPAAAERAFVAYEPYLRKVVRRLLPAELRPKFDSVDVVQSVYGDVLAAFRAAGCGSAACAQLRAFLIRATRNRFIDRVRQHQTAVRLERPHRRDASAGRMPLSPQPAPQRVRGGGGAVGAAAGAVPAGASPAAAAAPPRRDRRRDRRAGRHARGKRPPRAARAVGPAGVQRRRRTRR